SQLFEAIEAALAIAARHYPHELRRRRDAFAEQLFAPQAVESSQCDLLKPGNCLIPQDSGEVDVRNKQRLQNQHRDQEERREEEDDEEEEVEVEEGMGEEYDEVEALTDQMEEESRQIQEINRIKMRITDLELDDEELLLLLQTLQEMQISVEALKETEIGKEVNGLRKHSSKRIRSLAKLLVDGWKDMVNDWVKSAGDVAAAAALAGSSSGSTQDDHGENGLPSPPLEPGALLAAVHPPSAELFQLFDEGWDDDLTTGPGPSPAPHNATRTDTLPHRSGPTPPQGRREIRARSPDPPVANMKSRVAASNTNKPLKRGFEHTAAVGVNTNKTAKVSRGSLASSQLHDHPIDSTSPVKGTSKGVVAKGGSQSLQMIAKRPKVHQGMQQTLEDTSVAARLEVAKRRLQERYQEVENAKKSRVVQVMDLTELPKGGPNRARASQAHKPWTQNNSKRQHQSRR
ncbi:unnamed protein product, partial [Sphagnum jensenii]